MQFSLTAKLLRILSMEMKYEMEVIARLNGCFPTKFGLPRQSGLADGLKAEIVFEPKYRVCEAVRGLEEFSHIWLIWQFSEAVRDNWSPTVRPPRLGGNTRMGVFATRSPFRPNAVGLSCVRLEHIEYSKKLGPVLHVLGADLMDGTPIFDIKPYLAFTDSRPEASGGFADARKDYALCVNCPDGLLQRLPAELRAGLLSVLSQDPRPGYQRDPGRIYGFFYGDFEVRFSVEEQTLTVREIKERGI